MGWVENYANESVNQVGKYKYKFHYKRVDRSIEFAIRETAFEMRNEGKSIADIADHFDMEVNTIARYIRAAKKSYFGFNNPINKITVTEVNRQIEEERRKNSARIKAKREETLYS